MLRFVKYIAILVLVAVQAPEFYAQQTEITSHDSVRIYRSIESALQNPDKVFRLHLVRLKLREVPAEVFQLKNLRELVLDKNKITMLPDEIAQLENLEVLSCSHNQIDSITPAMLQLKMLTKLDLSDNLLGSVPENIDHLTELQYLILWDNPIYYYPNSLGDLKKLKVLDILNNQLNYSTRDRLLGSLPHTKVIFSPPCNCVDGME
jgi:Leucine-rich repeat (LRR) protein